MSARDPIEEAKDRLIQLLEAKTRLSPFDPYGIKLGMDIENLKNTIRVMEELRDQENE